MKATHEKELATGLAVWNWERQLVTYPRVIAEARVVDDIVAVMRDHAAYPSPVRALGSRHSTTLCGEADGGTVVDMRRMNRVIRIGTDSVTVEAGALYIDVSKELEKHDLQFYVNTEIGNLSMGAAACCATKDASMPGEYGQVNSYAIGMKIVTASGDLVEITEEDPVLLQAARSSYGLFGIVYEVTFRIRPLQAMAVSHEVFTLNEFTRRLPELVGRGQSMMLYILPFRDRIAVEFRRYTGAAAIVRRRDLPTRHVWRLRNYVWSTVAPSLGYALERYIPVRALRYAAVDEFNRLVQYMMTHVLAAEHTVPSDQIIRYPPAPGKSKYTFSIWAFPEEQYGETLREYFAWARSYYRERGWRPNMTDVGYRVAQDQNSLFSYTYEGTAITIDPVSTGAPGWLGFLAAHNKFSSDHGGSPLLNQTPGLEPDQVRRAFGERIDRFHELRRQYDPDDRLLNGYFAELLQ